MPAVQHPLPGARRSGGSGDLRQGNLTQILRYVRDHGPSSRHDIAHGCGLGISTMTDLVGELRSRGLVTELAPIRRPGAGRPTRPISLDGDPWCVIGAHLDSDKVQFSVATVGGSELWHDTVEADLRHAGPHTGLAVFQDMLRTQLAHLPADRSLVAVEIGLPGYVDRDRGTVGWSPGLDWRDVPLSTLVAQDLAAAGLPDVHVGIANDCHLAALHAARVELALPPGSVAAYLGGLRTLGSGVIIDGEIFRGASGGAGDFAHQNVDPSGPPDWCGRRGCLESLVGPVRLLTSAGLLSGEEATQLVHDQPRKAIQVVGEAAAAGEPALTAVLEQAGAALGRAIDDIIGFLNPHAVILGGYLGILSPHLMAMITAGIAERVSIAAFSATTVVPLGDIIPRVVAGATLAARDACLDDPLTLTQPLNG